MQTTRHEGLLRTASDEAARGVARAVKCGACIGFVSLLMVIGFSTGVNDARTADAASAAPDGASARVGLRAADHRKQVFDERRERFEGTAPAQLAMKPDPGGVLEFIAP